MPTTRTRRVTRTLRTRTGTPTSWGRPGSAAAARFQDTGRAGFDGEALVATLCADHLFPAGTYVFHDLVPPGGSGNIDHVILRGDTLIAVDAKRWRPGRYVTIDEPIHRDIWNQRTRGWVREAGTRPLTFRDGQRFEPGDVASFPFLVNELVQAIGWTGRTIRVVAISSSSGNDLDLDLAGYRLPHSSATTTDQFPRLVDVTLRRSRPKPVAATVDRLLRLTSDRAMVATPYPTALTGDPGTPRFLNDRARPVWPLAAATGAATIAAAVTGLHVAFVGTAMGPSPWACATGIGAGGLLRYYDTRRGPHDRTLSHVEAAVTRITGQPGPASTSGLHTLSRVVLGAALTSGLAPVVVDTLGRLPLLDAHSGPVRDLHLLAQIAATAVLAVSTLAGIMMWSRRGAWTERARWRQIVAIANTLPAWAVPLLAVRMGEQSDCDRWFAEISALSRSSAWRDFATEARQAAKQR